MCCIDTKCINIPHNENQDTLSRDEVSLFICRFLHISCFIKHINYLEIDQSYSSSTAAVACISLIHKFAPTIVITPFRTQTFLTINFAARNALNVINGNILFYIFFLAGCSIQGLSSVSISLISLSPGPARAGIVLNKMG